nr:MAG TPA: hypothetical protein [Caudoviricetes sp.]
MNPVSCRVRLSLLLLSCIESLVILLLYTA